MHGSEIMNYPVTHAWASDASISAFDFSAMPTAALPGKVSKPWRISCRWVRVKDSGEGWRGRVVVCV